MQRSPLPKGSMIAFPNGGTYVIDELIGEGGFSLVYSAHTAGEMSPVVIKEFFPADGAFRNDFGQPEPFEDYRTRFESNIERFENEGVVGGIAVQESFQIIPFQQCARGYALMQRESKDMRSINKLVESWKLAKPLPYSGTTKDYDPMYNDLVRVSYALRVVDSVLTALATVHSKGYLHLDLCSRNIIWAGKDQETGRNCVAFLTDFGCAVEINSNVNETKYLPTYSPGFAAPELIQGETCVPATDVFSVGVLLYYLCCSEAALEKTRNRNRQIQREIGHLLIPFEISKKCIEIITNATSELSLRFRTVEEFQVEVRKLSQMIEDFNALRLSFFPFGAKAFGALADDFFVGRENELAKIENRLRTHQSPIFLYGIGGIGKTSIAQKFAERYGWKYNVYFTTFKGSFKKTIAELQLHDDKKAIQLPTKPSEPESIDIKYATNIQILKRCNDRTVLIIDGADTQKELDIRAEKSFQMDLCGIGMAMQFIITTRNDMRSAREAICINDLGIASCLDLAGKYYSSCDKFKSTMSQICTIVHNHTITVELIAKTLEESGGTLKPVDILNALKSDMVGDNSWEKVVTHYGLDFKSRTVLGHLNKVFALSKLSTIERHVMGAFAMADSPFLNDELNKYWEQSERKAITKLISKGWLTKTHDRIMLHPCMRYVVLSNAQKCISWNGCQNYILSMMHSTDRHRFDIQRRNRNVFLFILQHPNLVSLTREYFVLLCCLFVYSCGLVHYDDPICKEVDYYYMYALRSCDEDDIIRYWIYSAYSQTMIETSTIDNPLLKQSMQSYKAMWYDFRECYVCNTETYMFIWEEIKKLEKSDQYFELTILCWMINDKKGENKNSLKWIDTKKRIYEGDAFNYSAICIHCSTMDSQFLQAALENVKIALEILEEKACRIPKISAFLLSYSSSYFVAARICELINENDGLKECCKRKAYYYSIMGLIAAKSEPPQLRGEHN